MIFRKNIKSTLHTDAFQQVYGTPLDTSAPKADDVTAIQPNTEYKDENGDSICGAPTLYSLYPCFYI